VAGTEATQSARGVAELIGELVRGGGSVGAHHDRSGEVCVPELLERQIEHPLVVVGGVGPGVAGRSTPASASRVWSR
jgi:hypothetical protein